MNSSKKEQSIPKGSCNDKREPWMCTVCPAGAICPNIDGHLAIEAQFKKWVIVGCTKEGCDNSIKIEERFKDAWQKSELPRSYCPKHICEWYMLRDIRTQQDKNNNP